MQAVWLALGGLVLSAFTSSTILPGNSEVVLAAFLYKWPATASPATCTERPRAPLRNCRAGWWMK